MIRKAMHENTSATNRKRDF